MENGALTAVAAEEQVVPESEHKKALARIRDLVRALGKSSLQNAILKEAIKVGREKKTHLACAVIRNIGFRVRPVAETIEVSRSNLIEQLKY